ncbi:MAG: hypothetical protein Kow002_21460 [Anaerolineales bacterium]
MQRTQTEMSGVPGEGIVRLRAEDKLANGIVKERSNCGNLLFTEYLKLPRHYPSTSLHSAQDGPRNAQLEIL